MNEAVIGVDIGGSHISSLSLIQEGSTYRPSGELLTTKVDGYGTRDEIIAGWHQHLNAAVAACTPFSGRIAVAMPGPFDYADGIAQFQGGMKFTNLFELNLTRSFLGGVAGAREIKWSNDAACFGLGESIPYHQDGLQRILAITLGTGVGSAFINDGRVVTTGPGIPPGGEIYAQPFQNGTADDYFSTRWFTWEAETRHGIIAKGVKELVDAESPAVLRQLFTTFTDNLKALLQPLILTFQPQVVVIGGNIARAWAHFAPELVAWLTPQQILLRPAQGGEYSACLGAALSCYPLTKLTKRT